jgi:hypothetical protein
MNIIATITAKQAIEELNHSLAIAQSSSRPNVKKVRQIEADLAVFSALPPQNTIWIGDDESYNNFMD